MKSKRTMKESKPETILQIIGPGCGAVSLNAKGWPGVHVFSSGDIPSLEGKLSSGLGMRIFFFLLILYWAGTFMKWKIPLDLCENLK